MQYAFGQTWWTGDMTIPLQFASRYDGQEAFVWGFNELVFNKLVFNKLVFNELVFNKLVFNELVFNKLVFNKLVLRFLAEVWWW